VQLMKPSTPSMICSSARSAPDLRHQDAVGDQRRRRGRDRGDRGSAVRLRKPDPGGRPGAILEPEVSISSPHKEQAETLLHDAITKRVEALPRARP